MLSSMQGFTTKIRDFLSHLVREDGLKGHALFKPSLAIHDYFLMKIEVIRDEHTTSKGCTNHGLRKVKQCLAAYALTATVIYTLLTPLHLLGLLVNLFHGLYIFHHNKKQIALLDQVISQEKQYQTAGISYKYTGEFKLATNQGEENEQVLKQIIEKVQRASWRCQKVTMHILAKEIQGHFIIQITPFIDQQNFSIKPALTPI